MYTRWLDEILWPVCETNMWSWDCLHLVSENTTDLKTLSQITQTFSLGTLGFQSIWKVELERYHVYDQPKLYFRKRKEKRDFLFNFKGFFYRSLMSFSAVGKRWEGVVGLCLGKKVLIEKWRIQPPHDCPGGTWKKSNLAANHVTINKTYINGPPSGKAL